MKKYLQLLNSPNKIAIVCIITIVLLLMLLQNYLTSLQSSEELAEGFTVQETLYAPDLYDKFYCRIYDKIFYLPNKNHLEITELEKHTIRRPEKVRLLDVGCGSGHHLNIMEDKYQVMGIDTSKSMLRQAKKRNPNVNLLHGDASNRTLMEPRTFTHITCYYFTIYYFMEPMKLLQNFYYWLKPGGYVALHVVNPKKFDPIVDAASPFPAFSLQKYTHKRITKCTVHFNNFVYNANFKTLDNDRYLFLEKFKFKKNGRVRKHVHRLYMLPVKKYIEMAENVGFRYVGKSDLILASCEYHYILYLRKPLPKNKKSNN